VHAAATGHPGHAPPRGFRSNIPSRRLPFVGRDDLSATMGEVLADPSTDNVIVLRGQPGAGKSELAQEFARRRRDRYPGGTFFIDGRAEAIALDLARLGKTCL